MGGSGVAILTIGIFSPAKINMIYHYKIGISAKGCK